MHRAICCCSFLFMCRGKWEVIGNETEVVMTHVLHYTALFSCTQVRERASSTVQEVGKFWSVHNPQKLRTSQIS